MRGDPSSLSDDGRESLSRAEEPPLATLLSTVYPVGFNSCCGVIDVVVIATEPSLDDAVFGASWSNRGGYLSPYCVVLVALYRRALRISRLCGS